MNSNSSSAQNLTALVHRLEEASADAASRLHLRLGSGHASGGSPPTVPWAYAAWMCMLLLAVCMSLRFMVEDIVRSSKAAARHAEQLEARALQQADAAERGAAQGEAELYAEKREFFPVDDATRAVEVVVHWTTVPARASVPTRRARSSGSGSPVSPM
jgi:hypothetical protein